MDPEGLARRQAAHDRQVVDISAVVQTLKQELGESLSAQGKRTTASLKDRLQKLSADARRFANEVCSTVSESNNEESEKSPPVSGEPSSANADKPTESI